MSIFCFFLLIYCNVIGELLDANIKKEMSDEVKDLEANVSIIFSLVLNVGVHSKTE